MKITFHTYGDVPIAFLDPLMKLCQVVDGDDNYEMEVTIRSKQFQQFGSKPLVSAKD